MTSKKYTPHVSDSVIRKNQSFLKAFHGVDPHLDIGRFGPENLFDEEDKIVIDLAGQMELEKVSVRRGEEECGEVEREHHWTDSGPYCCGGLSG